MKKSFITSEPDLTAPLSLHCLLKSKLPKYIEVCSTCVGEDFHYNKTYKVDAYGVTLYGSNIISVKLNKDEGQQRTVDLALSLLSDPGEFM